MNRQKSSTCLVLFALVLGILPGATAASVSTASAAPAVPTAGIDQPVLYFWNFEGNNGGFGAVRDWQWGTYVWNGIGCYNTSNVPPPAAHSGTDMWGTVLNTCYSDLGNNADYTACVNLDPADDSILSVTVDLTGVVGEAELSWWEWYDMYMPWDWTEVRVNDDVVFQHCGGNYVAPTAWVQQTVDLTPYAGGPATIEFHAMASTVVNYAGWYIDDVMVTGLRFSLAASKQAPAAAEFGDVISYTITLTPSTLLPGTFMADPLPPGVEYAGNLSWSSGDAWYSDTVNTMFWEYAAATAAAPARGAGTATSQVGPDASRSFDEDGGTAVLDSPPAGVTGPRAPEQLTWTVLPPPPTEASRAAGAVDAAGNFYIIGGESTGGRYGQLQRYHSAAGIWGVAIATMPVPASNICAAVIDDDIYIPGGYDGTFLADLQVFHIDSATWDVVATDPLPGARSGPACAAYDGKVYVFGGTDGTYQSSAWVYDPAAAAGSRWTTLAPVPIAGGYGAALAVGDLIFYAGMRDGAAPDLPYVYAYDPAANSWITYPSMATPRGGAGMWAMGDTLLVGGGGWGSYLTSVEQYDTAQGTGGSWTPFEASLVQGRRTFAYATYRDGGRLFAGDGWAGAYLAEAETVDSPVEISFDVMVTGRCGDVIANEAVAGYGDVIETFTATTVVGGEAILALSPSQLEAAACAGTTGVETLTLCNEGDCALGWTVYEVTPAIETTVQLPAGRPPAAGTATGGGTYRARPEGIYTLDRYITHTGPDVLLVNADDDNTLGSTIQAILQAYGHLGAVDLFNAELATPTPEQLQLYDVVVTWSNYVYADPVAMGNVLAGYVDAGGKVVNLLFSIGTHSWEMQGRFMTEDYTAMHGALRYFDTACIGTFNADHPIMTGVTDVCDYFRADGTSLTAGSSDVARWSDGLLFVAAKDDQTVVTINGYVGYSYQWTGQMPGVVHNAILWLTSGVQMDIPWLSQAPASGVVPRGECQEVEVTFDAAGLAPGAYTGDLLVFSNDLNTPTMTVPVTLTVPEPVSGAALSWSPAAPVAGSSVVFTATVAAGTPPLTYTWDFGDGFGDVGAAVSHVYAAEGTYDVELTAENACSQALAVETLAVEPGTGFIYLPIVVKNTPG